MGAYSIIYPTISERRKVLRQFGRSFWYQINQLFELIKQAKVSQWVRVWVGIWVGGLGWRLWQSADSPAISHSMRCRGGFDADAHAGRALLREVKGVVLTHRHFLAVAPAAVRRSFYTCAKPPSTNNSTPET
jgi:hypothetical protein